MPVYSYLLAMRDLSSSAAAVALPSRLHCSKKGETRVREHLKPGARVADWLWVASGKVDFLPIEKAHLRLASSGIRFVGNRVLVKHLPADTGEVRGAKKRVK